MAKQARLVSVLSLVSLLVSLFFAFASAHASAFKSPVATANAGTISIAQVDVPPIGMGKSSFVSGSAGNGSSSGSPVKIGPKAREIVGVWDLVSIGSITIPPKAKAYITESTLELRFDSIRYDCYTKANWEFKGDGVVITTTDASCKGEFAGDVDRGIFKLRGNRLEFVSRTYGRRWIFDKTMERLPEPDKALAPAVKVKKTKPKKGAMKEVSPATKDKPKAVDIRRPLAQKESAKAESAPGKMYANDEKEGGSGDSPPMAAVAKETPLTDAILIPPESPMKDGKPIFRWKAVPEAVWYSVMVTREHGNTVATGANSKGACGDGLICEKVWMNSLPDGSYKWEVWAHGGGGKTSFREKINFTVTGDQIKVLGAQKPRVKSKPKIIGTSVGGKTDFTITKEPIEASEAQKPRPQTSSAPSGLKIDMDPDLLRKMDSFGMLGTVIPLVVFGLIFLIVAAGGWKMYSKANVPGIFYLIPIANFIFLVKIAGKPTWWFILLFIPVVQFVILIIVALGIAKNFGKGTGFGIGLILLPFIFVPILGFGKARYEGSFV